MKWSIYNTIIKNNDQEFLLYNCLGDKLMVFVKEIKDIIDHNIEKIEELKNIHPTLYKYLLEQGFIIEDKVDEIQKAIEWRKKQDNLNEYFEIILNPTMNCNLKCWYCYETLITESTINKETFDSIKLFVADKIRSPKLKYFYLSFFGGEPLLEFNSTVFPLILFCKEQCDKYKKKLNVNFTSNGVLLSSKVADSLVATNIPISLQIPFDGSETKHDKVKRHSNGKGTYQEIVNNIKYGLAKGLHFNIRCNYSPQNIASFKELIEEFKEEKKEYKDQFHFSFQRIWQVNENETSINTLDEIATMLEDEEDSKYDILTSCYADMENSIVINYNGDIYKCTARDFVPELKEGVLNQDGVIIFNERYEDRMNSKFSNEECLKCRIFPFCDVCTQRKLEQFEENICLRMANEDDKNALINQRIKAVSNNKITSI